MLNFLARRLAQVVPTLFFVSILIFSLQHLLPIPDRAAQGLDLTGRWTRERAPQRFEVQHGTHLRASRRGRTGHDATLLMSADR